MILLWLKKYWKWVLATVAIAVAFFVGFFSRRPKILTPSTDVEDKKRDLEEKTESANKKAEESYLQEKTRIEVIQKQKEDEFIEKQRENSEKLQENPEELTNWLKKVGKNAGS